MPDDELKQIAEARLGRVLRGKYRLDRVLGIGGMAVVYAATHRNKKRFAIKMLHPELSMREQIRTRFLREGYVANSVEHPGAVAVLDDDIAEDGSAFVVMELLHGAPLDEVANRYGGRVPVSVVVSIADALLDVLTAAHAKGVIHRDLKPANLFLTTDGRLEVLDFGIARLHDETSVAGSATQTGAMLGTPAYMAPEQALAESSKVDAQTDLWAAGATMFTLLTGELVHKGDNASQLLVYAATKHARALGEVAPEVPRPIAAVIDKALVFAKGERWLNATEMRAALAKACVEATGAAVAPLPKAAKSESVTGLEETIASSNDVAPGSSGVGFEPTVDAAVSAKGAQSSSAATPLASTTGAGLVATRRSEEAKDAPAKKIPWRTVGGTALACVVVAGGAMAYRAAHAPRVRYCLDIAGTSDGPVCQFAVGAEVLGKRGRVVSRVTERAGHVTLVESVDFAGRIEQGNWPTGTGEFARLEVVRDDAGQVTGIVKYDTYGVMLSWEKWSEGGKRVDFVDIDGQTPRPSSSSGVTTIRVDYDAQGRLARGRFFGPTGRPRQQEDGEYGFAFEYGKTPFAPIKITYLGADGTPAPNGEGVVIQHRDDNGLPWGDEGVFDANEQPITNRAGVHGWRHLHDDYDWTGVSNLGIHGEPATELNQSLHEVRSAWDPVKHTVEVRLFDEQGRPQVVRGMWFVALKWTFDERGRRVSDEYLDREGNRVVTKNGEAAARFTFDDQNRETRRELLDPAGALTQAEEGFARCEVTPDAHDNKLEVRYYDAQGHLAPSKAGAAIERSTYDERDLRLTTATFDADDHPVANAHGFASEHDKYDHMRNLVEVAYFGPDGKPTAGDEGYAVKRSTYDENDDLAAVAYFDASGAPTPFESAYATKRMKYDERGLVIEEDYLDVNGDPVLAKTGYATEKRTRDRNGDVVEQAYFGKHGEPIARDGGFAGKKTAYDGVRRKIEVALFDTAGQAALGSSGWAIERTTYDERGLVLRVDHLDPQKNPVKDSDGRASVANTWDSRGNRTEETSLDVAGKPVASIDGYATKKTTYDDRDEVTEEALFGADGKPALGKAGWALRRARYDDFGDIVEESFFNVAHEPVVPEEAPYASMRQRYDERHRLVEALYFDERGVPTKGPDGVAGVKYKRDAYGHAIETSYFDGSGAPAASRDGRIVVRSKYDDGGRLTEEHLLDASGAARAGTDGCAGHRTKFDPVGQELEASCLDAKDAPTLSTDGWALRRKLYDARGNNVDIATYGADGTLRADKEGVARRRNRFDARNLLAEVTFFDASDKPAHDKRGAFAVRYTYDEAGAGKRVGETPVDAHGNAIGSATGKGPGAGK